MKKLMIRLFTAIPIPKDIRPMLHRMGCCLPKAKAVPEEQIHLTLRFIGEVESKSFLDIQDTLSAVSGAAFSLGIQGVGHFPPRGKPRVLWAGVQQVEQVAQLKRKVDACLATCGIAPDKRKFSPHITFARLNNTPLKRVTEFLAGNSFLHFQEFDVDRFHLFSSRLLPKGAVHTLEAVYCLRSD